MNMSATFEEFFETVYRRSVGRDGVLVSIGKYHAEGIALVCCWTLDLAGSTPLWRGWDSSYLRVLLSLSALT